MKGFTYEIRTGETDMFGLLPPAGLLKACLHCNMMQTESEGLTAGRLKEEFGAVWMLGGVRLRQTKPVYEGETLEVFVFSRGVEGCTYVRPIEVFKAGDRISEVKLSYITVREKDRRILRPSAVEEFWQNPLPLSDTEAYKKITMPAEAANAGSVTVRRSDCDINGHLSAFNYANLICEALGWWENGPKIASTFQIDFRSELLPGENVSLYETHSGDAFTLKGCKENKTTAFTAECVMSRTGFK